MGYFRADFAPDDPGLPLCSCPRNDEAFTFHIGTTTEGNERKFKVQEPKLCLDHGQNHLPFSLFSSI